MGGNELLAVMKFTILVIEKTPGRWPGLTQSFS